MSEEDPNTPDLAGPSRPWKPSSKRPLSPYKDSMESLEEPINLKRCHQTFNDQWLYERELGMKRKIGTQNQVHKSLYSALKPIAKWERMTQTGGIFNLEFSQDGSLLVAACEKKCVYMFDPLSRAVIGSIPDAHTDCVNYIRFLDTRVFATCSDDTTIALWDARNLKTRVRTLQGHSNWVKNIEFSSKDDLLVTAGFDGSIYSWDINNYTETGFVYDRVFQTNGLMRMRLSPDASKMVICTTAGYMILIHDLNLNTLAQDLMGFRPNMYRLMQLSDTVFPMAFEYHHLFSKGRTRNRVEFITDFPFGDEAEVISSLQIHPHGWCALSRNISNNERSEWTCVHDIQESPEAKEEEEEEEGESVTDSRKSQSSVSSRRIIDSGAQNSRPNPRRPRGGTNITTENRYPQLEISTADIWEALLVLREARSVQGGNGAVFRTIHQQEYDQDLVRIIRMSSGLPNDNPSEDVDTNDSEETESNSGGGTSDDVHDDDNSPRPARPGDASEVVFRFAGATAEDPATNDDESGGAARTNDTQEVVFRFTTSRSQGRVVVTDRGNPSTSRTATPSNATTSRPGRPNQPQRRPKQPLLRKSFVQNKPRLTHFVEELNVGRGYIKELCFSADGRLICSPFSFGVRLFSFNEDCAHMSSCVTHDGSQQLPGQLFELTAANGHADIVLSCKFSPKHNLLASGCLNGRIVLYQPVF